MVQWGPNEIKLEMRAGKVEKGSVCLVQECAPDTQAVMYHWVCQSRGT